MSVQRKLWVEKYRPESLDEIVGHDSNIERLQRYADDSEVPHMIFSGPPGTGKTAVVVAFAREVYGDDWRNNVTEMNASDERGIDTIRDKVKGIARSVPAGNAEYQILFLDEADALCLPGTERITVGYPSNRETKPISEVSEDGEPIPSVDFRTNEIQSDAGRMIETGTADFYRLTLSNGKEIVASPKHPFFTVGVSNELIEAQLKDLSAGDEIADMQRDIGVSQCEFCGEWSGNSRFCSVECKNSGHSKDMTGDSNPMHGVEWSDERRMRIVDKLSDGRLAGENNPNFNGEFHGIKLHELPAEVKEEIYAQISESHTGKTLSKEHRDSIARGVKRSVHNESVGDDYESKSYRWFVPDEETTECRICSEEKKTEGHDGIYVHHKDGNPENNNPSNLMLVCPRCHNMECHDVLERFLKPGWISNPERPSPESDGGRLDVETVTVESIEFDHHGPAYNITMDGTPNFMLANGILTHNTSDAQSALRRTMEQHSDVTRFFLSCNYPNKLIDAIQSRCSMFRFGRLEDDEIRQIVASVANKEGINCSEEAIDALVGSANGDARASINNLQSAVVRNDDGREITEQSVDSVVGLVDEQQISHIIDLAISGKTGEAMEILDRDLLKEGANSDIMADAFLREIKDRDMPAPGKVKILNKLAKTDWRIRQGSNYNVQWHSFVADVHVSYHLTLAKYEQ